MNRFLIFLSAVSLIFVTFGGVNAALVDLGNGNIYDDAGDGKFWYKDLSVFVGKTYSQTIDAIDAFPGTNAHLATAAEMATLWAYDANIIGGVFTQSGVIPGSFGPPDWNTWGGRYESIGSEGEHYYAYVKQRQPNSDNWVKYDLGTSEIEDSDVSSWYGAWVASDTLIAPIPSALWLLGSGLIGMVAVRRKFRN